MLKFPHWLAQLIASITVRYRRIFQEIRSDYWAARIRAAGGSVGKDFELRRNAYLYFGPGSLIHIGDRVVIDENARIFVGPEARLEIGNDAFVGFNGRIVSNRLVSLGVGTQIAHGVTLIDSDHRFENPNLPMVDQGIECEPINIGAHVWIGCNSVILKGVTLGERAVVGAGSIVNRDCDAGQVVVGAPARAVK
jgi:acetyltransferase-like isoleucine patch superfamily enzyme